MRRCRRWWRCSCRYESYLVDGVAGRVADIYVACGWATGVIDSDESGCGELSGTRAGNAGLAAASAGLGFGFAVFDAPTKRGDERYR